MVKEGPCYHCGIKSTPLWRNGPPEKPVLCNACGSRWRTRGTLIDYVPKHAMNHNIRIIALPANEDPNPTVSNPPDDANAAGPSDPNLENVPRRRRSDLDQVALSSIERLRKQLYDIMHEEPELFMKENALEDVLISQVNNMMATKNETALGAMLLNSLTEDLESVSSSSMKTPDNGDEPISSENGGNHGDQGESSST